MPDWGGCDVCAVIDELHLVLGETSLPLASSFADSQLKALDEQLKAAPQAPLAQRALIVADGLYKVGMTDTAFRISEEISRLVPVTDSANASLLERAQLIRARVLDTLGKGTEADCAFAMAEHLYTLAGRIQMLRE